MDWARLLQSGAKVIIFEVVEEKRKNTCESKELKFAGHNAS